MQWLQWPSVLRRRGKPAHLGFAPSVEPESVPTPPEIDEVSLRAQIAENPDLQDLKDSRLDLRTLQLVVDARMAARDVIEHLELHHISSYADLAWKLETQLERIKRRARIAHWRS